MSEKITIIEEWIKVAASKFYVPIEDYQKLTYELKILREKCEDKDAMAQTADEAFRMVAKDTEISMLRAIADAAYIIAKNEGYYENDYFEYHPAAKLVEALRNAGYSKNTP